MVVVGLCLAWYDQRRKLGEQTDTMGKQRLEITRLTVNGILRSSTTREQKLKALEPFVKLGDPQAQVISFTDRNTRRLVAPTGIVRACYYIGDLEVICDNGHVAE